MTNETEIFASALGLPTDRRKVLVHLLLESLPEDDARASEEAWGSEVERRLRDYDSGLTSAVPAEEVFAKYRS